MPNVNLTAPTDYTAEAADIARRRKMAEMLQAQGMAPIEQQTAGGYVIPTSWTQGLAKALQAGSGAYQQNQLKGEEKALGQRYATERGSALAEAMKAGAGTPEIAAQAAATPMDDEGNANPMVAGAPAVAGNRSAMLSKLIGSQFPDLQQMGAAQMLKEGDNSAFGKIDAKDFTPGSIAKFAASKNYADLVPVRKQESLTAAGPTGAPETRFYDPYAPPQQPVAQPVKQELGPAGQVYSPYQIQPGAVLNDPNKPFQASPNGGAPTANLPYQQYELGKARAGASMQNVNVNTEKHLYQKIADGVGEGVATAAQNAKAAVGTLQTVDQIRTALDSGKVVAGPGTSARVFLGQIGQVIGVAGKDATEQLTNTRNVIQGLAKLEMDAAALMKGQGQITENERKLIARAASGNIDDMTAPELRELTNGIDKTARYKIKTNAANVAKVKANPASASLADFMDVPEPAPYQPKRRAADKAAPKFLGFE